MRSATARREEPASPDEDERSIRAKDLQELIEGGLVGTTAFATKHGISFQRARQLALQAWRRATRDAMLLPYDARYLPDNWPLDRVPLTRRARDLLAPEGLAVVGDIRARTDEQMLAIPNLGRFSLAWLRHVTARGPDGPSQQQLEARIARLERDNATLRGKLRRIINAAKEADTADR